MMTAGIRPERRSGRRVSRIQGIDVLLEVGCHTLATEFERRREIPSIHRERTVDQADLLDLFEGRQAGVDLENAFGHEVLHPLVAADGGPVVRADTLPGRPRLEQTALRYDERDDVRPPVADE